VSMKDASGSLRISHRKRKMGSWIACRRKFVFLIFY
jgi:hypothetical protein